MSEDRLDRIEQALDNIRQRLDAQLEVNAALKTSVEMTNRSVADTKASVEALLQIATIHQQNFERLVAELQQHRSDGHGV